jgi:choice-of-anchor A domain-containing protein
MWTRSVAAIVLSSAVLVSPKAYAGFVLGDAATFVVLYEGAGKTQLGTSSVTINGNIGIGAPSGKTTSSLVASGPGAINGSVLFAGAVKDSITNTAVTGAVAGNKANVQTDLNSLNSLSAALGKETGTALSVSLGTKGKTQTIKASAGTLDKTGNRVFTVNSFNFKTGTTLVIQGDAAGHSVVLNFSKNAQFGGSVVLTGSLTPDKVLFNFTGKDTLQVNSQGAQVAGTFLDPNGTVSVADTALNGHVFGGAGGDMGLGSGATLDSPNDPPAVTPEPSTITLLASGLAALGVVGIRRLRSARTRAGADRARIAA